jgi:sortase A
MTTAALVCLWMVLQTLFLGSVSYQRHQDLMYDEFRAQLAGATAPVGPIVPAGDPVALMRVPRLGLEQVISEGTASGDTLLGPGHRRDTVLPGQVGTSVVYGRATTYGAPFASVPDLRVGDRIDIVAGQGAVAFSVIGIRREGDPLPQPSASGAARLTLVTAEGSGRFGGLAPESVVYVDAEADEGFPAPPGRPGAVPASEKAMAGDPGAAPIVTLYLSLLLAATAGVVLASQRWSLARVWVVGVPVVIATAWLTTDGVMRLLPNLI